MVSSKKRKASRVSLDPPQARRIVHDWEKDDEEVELEAALFGNSKRRTGQGQGYINGHGSGKEDGMEDVDDDELFTIDAPVLDMDQDYEDSDNDDDLEDADEEGDDSEGVDGVSEDEPDSADDSEVGASNSDSGSESGASIHFDDAQLLQDPSTGKSTDKSGQNGMDTGTDAQVDHNVRITFPTDLRSPSPIASGSRSPSPSRKGKERSSPSGTAPALWTDPADELISIDLLKDRRMRKLARGKGTDGVVDGRELGKRLREQFERLHPRPEWASNRIKSGTPSLSSLLSSTKSFIARPTLSDLSTRPPLARGTISMQRLLDANHQNPTTGKKEASNAGNGVVDVAWHPSSRVGVLVVGGGDRRVRFFNIDGHTNAALLTIHLPSLPLGRTTFHPSGTSLLMTGSRPYYYTYDLLASKCLRSPRNLFGSVPDPTSPNQLDKHAFSPDGSMLAVAGRRGAVSILDWSGSGVGAVVAELKSGRGGSVADLVWTTGTELSVLGGRDGAEVEVWNVGSRRVVRKWKDDRNFGGSVMRLSADDKYTAVGSSTGIVNLYDSSSLRSNQGDDLHLLPEPVRSLEHLTTPITSVAFHPGSELMATGSNSKRNRLKLYHLASGSAYSNWPTTTTPLGRINAMGFSSAADYLAMGNQRGKVLLYSLKHYANA